ncbi:hypothetical protein POTOM_029654 [Populus tomentosa]|uniref:EF-hand domain-containing protein n=1 Tax=Populus tomentosa TaxID=118781 RepID=A0A8X8CU69_POPTO|nr:hypothetical protein POTOM_029654 [Populus tomentosa]
MTRWRQKKELSGKEAVIDKELLEAFSQKLNSLFFVCNLRISGLFLHLPPINISFLGQAFRCFDWNQTGYIRVEDMRLIIHSLGTFLSHTKIKVRTVLLYPLSFTHKGCTRTNVLFLVSNGFLHQELVQSALLESNTGREDCILYNKLVRMNHLIL